MADASDSKSDVGDYVWVQVPSPALEGAKRIKFSFAPFVCLNINIKRIKCVHRCIYEKMEKDGQMKSVWGIIPNAQAYEIESLFKK